MITLETARPVMWRFDRRLAHELANKKTIVEVLVGRALQRAILAAQQKPANTSGYRRQRRRFGRHWGSWRDRYDAILADRGCQ